MNEWSISIQSCKILGENTAQAGEVWRWQLHYWPSDSFTISCCHSSRSPFPLKTLFKELFGSALFRLRTEGRRNRRHHDVAFTRCSMQCFVMPFLWAAWIYVPWRSSKPEEQSAFLFWITDTCSVSEMKSLATELLSLPYFTHLAYSMLCFKSLPPPESQ